MWCVGVFMYVCVYAHNILRVYYGIYKTLQFFFFASSSLPLREYFTSRTSVGQVDVEISVRVNAFKAFNMICLSFEVWKWLIKNVKKN